MRRRNTWIAALALACSAGAAPGASEKAAPDKAGKPGPSVVRESVILKAARPPAPGVKVWTNEDLARLAQGGPWATEVISAGDPQVAEAPAVPAAADPLTWLENEQEQAHERQGMVAEAEAEVSAARSAVQALEVQSLAVRNPFSARPKLSEQEIEYRRTSGETAMERAARTQKALEEARAKLAAALAKLERVGGGSR